MLVWSKQIALRKGTKHQNGSGTLLTAGNIDANHISGIVFEVRHVKKKHLWKKTHRGGRGGKKERRGSGDGLEASSEGWVPA